MLTSHNGHSGAPWRMRLKSTTLSQSYHWHTQRQSPQNYGMPYTPQLEFLTILFILCIRMITTTRLLKTSGVVRLPVPFPPLSSSFFSSPFSLLLSFIPTPPVATAGGPGELLSSLSGSWHSPAAKQHLMHFGLKKCFW